MRPWCTSLVLLALSWTAPLLAQESLERELREQRANTAPGTAPWFIHGFEIVEAQLWFDGHRAVDSSRALIEAARSSDLPGVLTAALAQHAAAVATVEGPARASELAHFDPTLSESAAPDVGAYFHLAQAHRQWLEDRPTDVISSALAALTDARASGAPLLRLRAAWLVHTITEKEAQTYDQVLLREIRELMASPEGAHFAPWGALNDYWNTYSEHTRDERIATLDAVASQCEARGDLRTRVMVEWERAVVAGEAHDVRRATELLESSRTLAQRLGDLRTLAVSIELTAEVALESGELARAESTLRELEELLRGRGLPDEDVSHAHLMLRLSIARKESAAIVTWTQTLEQLREAEGRRHQDYPALREQLLSTERQRIEFDARLAEERELAEQSSRTLRRVLAAGGIGAMVIVVLLALHSRRKLLRVNARLVDEMKRAEDEATARRDLEKRMRLLERTESLGLIASGIAHDFNNLMVGVLGNAELLRDAEPNAERARRLDSIVAAGERGARLCAQLQAYTGDAPVRFEVLDVAPLLRELAPVLDAAAGTKARFELGRVEDELAIDGSEAQVEQAVLNLVANARDAQARSIRLDARRVQMTEAEWSVQRARGETRAGSYVCVEVTDDGEGMPAELVERIFDPFFTTRFPGRGLGLAVVFGAVRRHAGAIAVESTPERGSCFRLYFPSSTGRAPARAPSASSPHTPAMLRVPVAPMDVLVIDDEADVRDFVKSALEVRGHRVTAIADGASAVRELETLAHESAAVALVDMTMPVVDGRAVIQALRGAGFELATVIMSGHAASHLAEWSRDLDVDGVLAKPFTPSELENILALALESRRKRARAAAEPELRG